MKIAARSVRDVARYYAAPLMVRRGHDVTIVARQRERAWSSKSLRQELFDLI